MRPRAQGRSPLSTTQGHVLASLPPVSSNTTISPLPQSATGGSSRSRVFTRLSLRRRPSPLVRASTGKNVRQSIVPLVTRIFIDLILLLVGPRQRELDRPRSRKRGGIVDRHLVC